MLPGPCSWCECGSSGRVRVPGCGRADLGELRRHGATNFLLDDIPSNGADIETWGVDL